MPGRKVPLVTNQIYHILNRGIASQPVFVTAKDFQRAIGLMRYYQNKKPPLRYAQFLVLARKRRKEILSALRQRKQFLVEIIVFCFLNNHFHFLLKQKTDGGISQFMSNFANSYTRYFNTKNKRIGPVFQGKFKAIRVETNEQLLHLSRYIHLNPYSSYKVKSLKELEDYPYSSFSEYLGRSATNLCHKALVLGQFQSPEAYKRFVLDQADYQRRLAEIKHLILERWLAPKVSREKHL